MLGREKRVWLESAHRKARAINVASSASRVLVPFDQIGNLLRVQHLAVSDRHIRARRASTNTALHHRPRLACSSAAFLLLMFFGGVFRRPTE